MAMKVMRRLRGIELQWCRRGESNPRPRDYETLALPLSYAGTGPSCYGYRHGGVKPGAAEARQYRRELQLRRRNPGTTPCLVL
jgi:hypothetical protein